MKVPRVPCCRQLDAPANSRPIAICGCASAKICPRRAAAPTPSAANRSFPPNSRALHSLYGNYESTIGCGSRTPRPAPTGSRRRRSSSSATTRTSRSSSSTTSPDGKSRSAERTMVRAGALALFRNDDGHGALACTGPNTILVDSEQLESGEAMSDEFKKIAAREIEEFKAEYRARFPGRRCRGAHRRRPAARGHEHRRQGGQAGRARPCVVSVSRCSPRAGTPTLSRTSSASARSAPAAVRAGRRPGLRRMSYAVNDRRPVRPGVRRGLRRAVLLHPDKRQYCRTQAGADADRVRALGRPYRVRDHVPAPRRLSLRPARRAARRPRSPKIEAGTLDTPTSRPKPRTPRSSARPASTRWTTSSASAKRSRVSAGKLTLEKYFRQDGEARTDRPTKHRFDADVKTWLFPQLLVIAKRWLDECVTLKDNTFPQLLLLIEFAHDAADRIYKAIVGAEAGSPSLKPILRPYDTVGSTRYVDFDTIRSVYPTRADRCHVSHVVADTGHGNRRWRRRWKTWTKVVALCEEPQLGFHHSIHAQRRGAPIHTRLHRGAQEWRR